MDPAAGDHLKRRRVFGLDMIDAPDLVPVLDAVLAWDPTADPQCRSDSGSGSGDATLPLLVTPNVDIIVQLERSTGPEVDLYQRARFVLPDGMPIVKSSSLLGQPLSGRLTGSGLFEVLWPEVQRRRCPVVLLCSDHKVAKTLDPSRDHTRIVVPPQFDLDDDVAIDRVIDDLLAAAAEIRPKLVLFGLGHPKDAVLSGRLLERWPGPGRPLCCCLGGSFVMYGGVRRRAPLWMQNAGLEWFFRFLQEPRRLFRRYFIRDVAFIKTVAKEWRRVRRERADHRGTPEV